MYFNCAYLYLSLFPFLIQLALHVTNTLTYLIIIYHHPM